MNYARLTAITVVATVLLLSATTQLWAGAWTMPQGKLYTRVAYSEYEANRYFYEDGSTEAYAPNDVYKNKRRDFDYDEQTWSVYAEYGLLDNLTLIGSFDYKETEWTYQSNGRSLVDGELVPFDSGVDKTARASGLADIKFGLRYRLMQTSNGVLSLQALYKTGEAYDEKDQNLGTDIQLGDGQDDFELRLQYGQSLYPLIPGYFNVEAGYNWRTQQYGDEFRYLIEAGVDITKALYARTKLDGTANVGNGDDGPDGSFTEVDSNPYEVDLGKLEVTLGYKITSRFSIEASYFNELYGASTTKGDTWSLAVATTLF
nr:hypothetical protein [uncultured Desulfuromonas sp.]